MAKPNNKTEEQKDNKSGDNSNTDLPPDNKETNVRKSLTSWASDERLPSWKIASIVTEHKITADKMLTKSEFHSICRGK